MSSVTITTPAELFRYRRLTSDEQLFYREQGYLVLQGVLTDDGLHQLRDECTSAWQASKQAFDPDKTWLQNSLLVNIHHVSPVAREYYFRGPLIDVAEQLIGPNIKGATSQLTFKMRGNRMPFGWHQDNGYGQLDPPNAISTLTALDDTNEENGCLWIIPGSHHRAQIAAMTAEQKAAGKELIVDADESDAMPVPLRAGDALIFHCWTLHKSEGNLSHDRDRRILFMRYADADAVEVYNDGRPRLGRLLRGQTQFDEVRGFEANL